MKHGVLAMILALVLSSCNTHKEPEETTRKGTLKVLASEPLLVVAARGAELYQRLYPEAVIMVEGVSTRQAIVEMANGTVRSIIIDRRMNEEERKFIAQSEPPVLLGILGFDAFAVIVNLQNGMRRTSLDQCRDMFTGVITDWRAISGSRLTGPIETSTTGANTGLYDHLQQEYFSSVGALPLKAPMGIQLDVMRYVAAQQNAIGIVSNAFLKDTTQNKVQGLRQYVRVLDFTTVDSQKVVQNVRLTQETVYDARYPFRYTLYIYTRERRSAVATGFADFMLKFNGQKILQDAGLVPREIPKREVLLISE
ncbi:MAG: substrate-binding domain-containing protein [bacterium]